MKYLFFQLILLFVFVLGGLAANFSDNLRADNIFLSPKSFSTQTKGREYIEDLKDFSITKTELLKRFTVSDIKHMLIFLSQKIKKEFDEKKILNRMAEFEKNIHSQNTQQNEEYILEISNDLKNIEKMILRSKYYRYLLNIKIDIKNYSKDWESNEPLSYDFMDKLGKMEQMLVFIDIYIKMNNMDFVIIDRLINQMDKYYQMLESVIIFSNESINETNLRFDFSNESKNFPESIYLPLYLLSAFEPKSTAFPSEFKKSA